MLRKTLIVAGIVLAVAFVAAAVQIVSHRMWERRVWTCYEALGSGTVPLKTRFLVPPACRGDAMMVADLGTPDAAVVFAFRPPRTMWVSYAFGTVDYDSYSIEVHRRNGAPAAEIHHGSD